jgi:hypothetical protein
MKFVKALVVAFLLAHGAYAEGHTPFRALAVKKVSKRSKVAAGHAGRGYGTREIPTISFTTRLHTEGNVRVALTSQKVVNWTSTISRDGGLSSDNSQLELYQGEVKIRGKRYPAAGSVVGKNVVLSFPGRTRGSHSSRQRIFTVTAPAVQEGEMHVRVASSPSAIFHNKACGHEHAEGKISPHSTTVEPLNVGLAQARMYHVLTLSTVGDPALYAQYGANTNAHIASIVNAAEVLFSEQLGIRFQIVKQHVYADVGALSIPETDPGRLLKAFANSSENSAVMGINAVSFDDDVDIKHLFTGKDLDGTTVGIAYIGTVCYQPKFAYSLTQMTSGGGAPYYFAHEIGHNLGARHEAATWGSMSLMAPNIMIGSRFSQGSLDQINDHLLHFGSCLELKAMPPSLTNSRLNLRTVKNRRMVKFVGSLVSALNEPIAGTPVKLIVGRKTVALSTNEMGKFVYTIQRNKLKNATAVYATTPGGEARSEALRRLA